MRNIREVLKNIQASEYSENKVNLHIHTNCSDGEGDCKQILESAKKQGYKLISITDHNTVEAHKILSDEILVTGVEFDCWFGYVFIHLIAYGIDINHPSLQPFLAKNKAETEGVLIRLLPKRNVKNLIHAIHEAGGVAILAHPACYWAISLDNLVKNLIEVGLDGIEVYYPYPRFRKIVKFHSSSDVKKVANKYPKLIQTGGTDFHGKKF
jgi:hypothetical protein